MEVCSWDWGAITTLISTVIASATAWCISNKWREQKSMEIRAIEARNLLEYLFQLDSLFYKKYNIYQERDNTTISTDQKSIDEFKIIIQKITRLLNFLELEKFSDQFIFNIKSIEKDLDIDDLSLRSFVLTTNYQISNKYEQTKKEIDRLIGIAKKIAQFKDDKSV